MTWNCVKSFVCQPSVLSSILFSMTISSIACAENKQQDIEELTVLAERPAVKQEVDKYTVPAIKEIAMHFELSNSLKPQIKLNNKRDYQ